MKRRFGFFLLHLKLYQLFKDVNITMSNTFKERIKSAINEYKRGLELFNQAKYREAKNHMVKALRILEDAYRYTKGVDRLMIIRLFEKISDMIRVIDQKF